MLSLVPLLLLSSVALGLLLIILGMRGKRVDPHPYCFACSYALRGAPIESMRCPECGADTTQPDGIRTGRRRANRTLICLGILSIACFCATTGTMLHDKYSEDGIKRFKPVWLLQIETREERAALPSPAADELIRRLLSDELSPAQVNSVVEMILELQANEDGAWCGVWGEFVEEADFFGLVKKEQIVRYLRQSHRHRVDLNVRRRVNVGEWIPCEVTIDPNQSSGEHCPIIENKVDVQEIRVDGVLVDSHRTSLQPSPTCEHPETSRSYSVNGVGLTLGKHELEIMLVCHLQHAGRGLTVPFALHQEFEILPWSTPAIERVTDPACEAVHASVQGLVVESAPDEGLVVECEIKDPPIPMVYDIYLRSEHGSLYVDTHCASKEGGPMLLPLRVSIRDLGQDVVDVVFEPNSTVARRTIGIEQMWDERIIFPGVPIDGEH